MSQRWINGVMIDCVRITERTDYYRKLIPQLADWGYNTIFWHFTDDQGCALKLKSRPELSSRYALSRQETEGLIRLAARYGIEVVPEVESLGHTLYITHLKPGNEALIVEELRELLPERHPRALKTGDVFEL